MTGTLELKKKISLRDRIKDKKSTLQFLPSSLEDISNTKTIKYNNTNLKSAYLIDIIHNLLLKYYFKSENSFNLSSLILKEKYGHKYNYYMNYLVSYKFIILIRNHQKGKNSKVYKLNESIIKGDIKRYRNADTILLKKYKNSISLIDDDPSYGKYILPDVKKKLVNDLYSVNIDFAKSIFFLEITNKDNDIYNKNKYSVECIKDSNIFYHFDTFGRLHTNFTILKSFIRKNCLLIDNEETYEIDIPNSQPLFLCKLIYENDIFIVDESEFELFKNLTLNGNFYQYIMNLIPDYIDKKMVKEMVYKVFFGRNYSNNKHDINFIKLFPTIYKFIKSYKREMGDYRSLAYYLQRTESNFIFNEVINTSMKLYPDIKFITVHDSLIFPKIYREIIEIIFNQKIKEEFNFVD